jgi:molybdopterin-dependent oxidoreductase alpha subunit
VKSLKTILLQEGVPASGPMVLSRQNKVDGFQCVSCAWVKPGKPLPFEFCENGAKATAWEITAHRCTPDFFAAHTVSELLGWDDFHLEATGRLTHPLRYDAASDTYKPVSWGAAIAEISGELRAVRNKKETVFYSSGRCSNEASYLYGLFARLYGNNNLPDSSNMCHETTSVALPESIGVPVGTVALDDFAKTDCILFFGQNPGSNSPRMLHPLQAASERGVPIIAFNPLRERGLERFTNPQSPLELLSRKESRIASHYLQVKAGGDLAALTALCKTVLALDDAARATGGAPVIDWPFIDAETYGLATFADWLRTPGLGGTRTAFWPDARRAGAGGRHLRVSESGNRHLRHGADAASRGRGDRADGRQSAADARQYRQGWRRYLPGTRPFQRARAAHGRNYREAGTRAYGPSRAAIWLRTTA